MTTQGIRLFGMSLIFHFLTLQNVRAEEPQISVMFWNVENLFDTIDDDKKKDEEFTPDGRLNWTEEKLQRKMTALATVIKSIKNPNGKSCPDFIGMAEVEHGQIAQRFNREYLGDCGYTKVIADPNDPDPRGIRVVTMTRLELAGQPISHKPYQGGRFIQEVSVKVGDSILTLFVNHWKSRLGGENGEVGGEDRRIDSAKTLHDRTQALLTENPRQDILAMGDFNDEPENSSLRNALESTINLQKFIDEARYMWWNPSSELLRLPALNDATDDSDLIARYRKVRGTYYFHGEKQYLALDNFHMTRGLLDDEGFSYTNKSFEVVRHPDFSDSEMRPIPFINRENRRGAADHFPILSRFTVKDSSLWWNDTDSSGSDWGLEPDDDDQF